jgi:DNA-directed RNA polymerase II subunit RPB2
MSNQLSRKDIMKLIDLYFEENNWLYRHQYESYEQYIDDFIKFLEEGTHIIHDDFAKDNKLYRNKLIFSNIVAKPAILENGEYMFPEHARTNSLSYDMKILADVKQMLEIIEIATDKKEIKEVYNAKSVPIVKMPIMVKSKYCSTLLRKDIVNTECLYDPGCYFIVSGSEKVVIAQERISENKIFIFTKKDPTYRKGMMYMAQIDSKGLNVDSIIQKVLLRVRKDETITLSMGQLLDIPLFIIFRGLGLSNDNDIIKYCVHDENDIDLINILKLSSTQSILHPNKPQSDINRPIRNQDDAIKYLITKLITTKKYNETDIAIKNLQKKNHLMKVLSKDLFPHIGDDFSSKIQFLGLLVNKLLNVYIGRLEPDDRDLYDNKRVETTGVLLMQLTKQGFKKFMNDLTKFFKKKNASNTEPINVLRQIKPTTIETTIKSGLMTGTWGMQKKKTGVAQVLQQLTYLQKLSYLRRVVTPGIDSSNKQTSIRHVNNIQYGFLDAVESQDGASVGIVKHLSLAASITLNMPNQVFIIKNVLADKLIDLNDIPTYRYKKDTKVFLNGEWLGMVIYPGELLEYLEKNQMNGIIDNTVSFILDFNLNELRIYTDGGRLFRPLLRIKNNEFILTKKHLDEITLGGNAKDKNKITKWNQFMMKYPDVVQYVDVERSEYILIGMFPNDIYEHNKKMKELINNPNEFGDNINRYQNTYKKYTHCELHPFLQLGVVSCNVPFSHHNPSPRNVYNFAQARQAMGLYTTNYKYRMDISYILYNTQLSICSTKGMKYSNVDILPAGENVVVAVACYTGYNQEDSIIFNQSSADAGLMRTTALKKYEEKLKKNQSTSQDEKVVDGDMIIGKVTPIEPGTTGKVYKDSSHAYKGTLPATIDKVLTGIYDSEGYEIYKMRLRSERRPNIGDKFACYSPDHEVLTLNGWKPINNITKDDHIASMNEYQELEYVNPIEIQEYDYSGKMYNVESENTSLLVTPNHRMYVSYEDKWEILIAEEIYGKTIKYKKNVKNYKCKYNHENLIYDSNKIITHYVHNNIQYPINEFITFFGKWIANMHILCNNDLINIFNSFNDKYLPSWVWYLSLEQSKLLLNSITSNNHYYITTSKQLADDIQKLCLHSGYAANIKFNSNNLIINIIISQNESKINNNIHHDKWIDYNSKVYCCSVSGPGIIYVRRNGITTWCGNSRHSQKGTIGMVLHRADMPFTKEGIQPDLIINSHCIPSRGTIGHILEMITSKYGAIECQRVDATTFEPVNMDEIRKGLKSAGYEEHGYETLYNGMTGIKMRSMLFIGPCYYMRLKHMVNDKIHCLDYSTEVLTTNRWKTINELSMNDRIITLNIVTKKIEEQKPTNILTYPDYEGEIYYIKNNYIDMVITNEHRVLINDNNEYKLVKINELLGKSFKLVKYINNEVIVNMNEDLVIKYERKPVFCLTVANEVFYVRRNNKCYWTGNSRSRGPMTLLTRQPPEGRSKDGGLRFGEMEKDAMISYGSSLFLKERFMELSDIYQVKICNNCGLFASKLINKNVWGCSSCKNYTDIALVEMPYAFKLMIQELQAINILPRIRTKNTIYTDGK